MNEPITHIVVHYSATYPDNNLTAADVDRMHKARGWKGIGYHWFIRRDGTVEPGRPESQVGAHVDQINKGKIGICWAGGIDRATGPNKGVDNRTMAQTNALIAKIRELQQRYPNAAVVGHRDLSPTQCPGFDVRAWWQGIPGREPKPADPVHTPDVNEQLWHVVERGDTLWAISREYGVELDEILRLNNFDDNTVIHPGDRVLLHPLSDGAIKRLIAWLGGLLKGDET